MDAVLITNSAVFVILDATPGFESFTNDAKWVKSDKPHFWLEMIRFYPKKILNYQMGTR